ncbi:cupin domain-containing protein [Rhodococcus wratislaviensis]|uniref:cupin domain-containing protein n=1 Tax=Rhodococcus wratislaviensis TaxID=44752 RepID=UPI003656B814
MPPGEGAWEDVVLSEWQLDAAGASDRHDHVEVNFVIEGELHVEVDGVEVIARSGDTVWTPRGAVGRYWAPKHARMLSIYGANPLGGQATDLRYWEL